MNRTPGVAGRQMKGRRGSGSDFHLTKPTYSADPSVLSPTAPNLPALTGVIVTFLTSPSPACQQTPDTSAPSSLHHATAQHRPVTQA